MEEKKCVYCGEHAETKDHIVPVAYYYSGKRAGRHFTSDYGKENLVDCCRQCNSIAGNKAFHDFVQKKKYIQERLEEKYKKIINAPYWSKEEIKELGYSLKKDVMLQQLARLWVLNRINYPEEVYSSVLLDKRLVDYIQKQL